MHAQTLAQRAGKGFQKYVQEIVLSEIEEESYPNINNGLPVIKSFDNVTRSSNECDQLFVLFQLSVAKTTTVDRYRADLLVSQTSLLYNRALIARVQTFMHQAMLNKVHNATAEADFDERYQALQKRTSVKFEEIMKKSEFEIACTLKGIEVLVPDDTNFEEARYLMLQTSDILLRSKSPDKFCHKLDAYFENCID